MFCAIHRPSHNVGVCDSGADVTCDDGTCKCDVRQPMKGFGTISHMHVNDVWSFNNRGHYEEGEGAQFDALNTVVIPVQCAVKEHVERNYMH